MKKVPTAKHLEKALARKERSDIPRMVFEMKLGISGSKFSLPREEDLIKLAIKCGIPKKKAGPYIEHVVRHWVEQLYGEKKVLKTKSGSAIMWHSRSLSGKGLQEVLGEKLVKEVRLSAQKLTRLLAAKIGSKRKISNKDAANIVKHAIGLHIASLRGLVKEKFFYKILMPIGFWLNENDE